MFSRRKKRSAVGLDIGGGSVKAVEVCWSAEDGAAMRQHRQFRLHAEGIISEEDLSHSVAAMIDGAGWRHRDICVGLPQYLTTVQVREFPAAPESQLREMISYETRQLSGISEESFDHDYHVMPPRFERINPVLIGISRHSVVADKIDVLAAAGVTPVDITMNGMAVANSLFELRPEAAKNEQAPQLVVEIGADSSTVVFFAADQILSINSLMAGGQQFTKAIAKSLGVDENKAEEEKTRVRIDLGAPDSPLHAVAAALVDELESATAQWRLQEGLELARRDIAKIWLCGGGALMPGLAEMIAARLNCQVELFGPKESQGDIHPELATAFGLALQAAGAARFNVSLASPEIRWTTRRNHNFGLLAVGCALLVALMFLFLLNYYRRLKIEEISNRQTIARLAECQSLIPQLDKLIKEIRFHEKTILPFAVRGNNIPRFISAITEIGKSLEPDALFLFIADEDSFREIRAEAPAAAAASAKPPTTIRFGGRGRQSTQERTVADLRETKAMILLGFTISASKREHYETVRLMQRKLDESPLFGSATDKVDILAGDDEGSGGAILEPWINKVVNNRNIHAHLQRRRFHFFAIRLPFADPIVNAANLAKEIGGKGK